MDFQLFSFFRTLSEILGLCKMQALTHARVPIVKFTDPLTGISCDICINNILAVVNTKLIYDYAQIDICLQPLAFMVKHWAKSRQINETYQGTLSSYVYVLMCIHFLQQHRPPILPCSQEMDATYQVMIGNIECASAIKLTNWKTMVLETRRPLVNCYQFSFTTGIFIMSTLILSYHFALEHRNYSRAFAGA